MISVAAYARLICAQGRFDQVKRPNKSPGVLMRLRFAQVPSVRQVSSGNPCPFLRALVADGTLPDGLEPVKHIASALVDAAKKGEGAPTLPAPGIYAVAFTANGLALQMSCTTCGMACSSMPSVTGPMTKKALAPAF